jgi:aspartate oxidase
VRVTIVTKREDFMSNTNYAQGGMAVVLSDRDSFRQHVKDTLVAGAGLCHPDVVRAIVQQGPAALAELVELGVRFTREQGARDHGGLELGREGGHSQRRIVHAGDLTGREIERALLAAVQSHGNITMLENHLAVDLLLESHLSGGKRGRRDAVWGAYVLDRDHRHGRIRPFRARATVLATGGSGKVYLYTTNPDIATGDGVAMAWRAGAPIANLEFVQFHPTCLYHPRAKSFLITEAVRGEGAHLLTIDGTRFMPKYDRRAELAPRDIVARAIDAEMKKRGDSHVLLDFRRSGRRRSSSASRTSSSARASSATTRSRNRCRSCRRRTTSAAASSPTCRGARRWIDSSPSARSPAPACTGRTGWPRTRCSRRSWSPTRRPRRVSRASKRAGARRASRRGTRAGCGSRARPSGAARTGTPCAG